MVPLDKTRVFENSEEAVKPKNADICDPLSLPAFLIKTRCVFESLGDMQSAKEAERHFRIIKQQSESAFSLSLIRLYLFQKEYPKALKMILKLSSPAQKLDHLVLCLENIKNSAESLRESLSTLFRMKGPFWRLQETPAVKRKLYQEEQLKHLCILEQEIQDAISELVENNEKTASLKL